MAWWQAPVITATWEAEAEEWLEPGRQRLQLAKSSRLHSSLGNKRETLSPKIKQNKIKLKNRTYRESFSVSQNIQMELTLLSHSLKYLTCLARGRSSHL